MALPSDPSDPRRSFYHAKTALTKVNKTRRWIFVQLGSQKVFCYEANALQREYSCSTSLKPASCQYGSNGTPLGLHRIAQKIGAGTPSGMVFEKRVATGKIAREEDPAAITSRILWLEGLEENKNMGHECDTFNRKIYIHGTNHESEIGTPKSHGCVELTNADIMELFDWAEEGTLVLID